MGNGTSPNADDTSADVRSNDPLTNTNPSLAIVETITTEIPSAESVCSGDQDLAKIGACSSMDSKVYAGTDSMKIQQHSPSVKVGEQSNDEQSNDYGERPSTLNEDQSEEMRCSIVEQAHKPEVMSSTLEEHSDALENESATCEDQSAILEEPSASLKDSSAGPEQQSIILEENSATFEEQSTTIEEQSVTLEERSTTLEDQSTTLEETTTTLEDNSTGLDQKSIVLEEKSATFEEQSTTIEEQSATLEEQSTTLEDQSTTLEETTTTLEDNLAGLEKKLVIFDENSVSLEEKSTTTEEQSATFEEQSASLEEQPLALAGLSHSPEGSDIDSGSESPGEVGTWSDNEALLDPTPNNEPERIICQPGPIEKSDEFTERRVSDTRDSMQSEENSKKASLSDSSSSVDSFESVKSGVPEELEDVTADLQKSDEEPRLVFQVFIDIDL
jgi:hypothetical protein